MHTLSKTIAVVVSILLACLEERAVAGDLFVIIATDDGAPTWKEEKKYNLVSRTWERSIMSLVASRTVFAHPPCESSSQGEAAPTAVRAARGSNDVVGAGR